MLPQEYDLDRVCRRNSELIMAGDLPFVCHPYITKPKMKIKQLKCVVIPRGKEGTRHRKWMRQFLREWHYIPRQEVCGRRVYMLWYDTIPEDLVAIVIFCNPQAIYLPDREEFIGWTDEQRKAMLNKNVADEARFLVLPHVRIPNLQSKILAHSCKWAKHEWKDRYGDDLVLITCFVDPKLYIGHSYRGAGFVLIGHTKDGKQIMARGMVNNWREVLTETEEDDFWLDEEEEFLKKTSRRIGGKYKARGKFVHKDL